MKNILLTLQGKLNLMKRGGIEVVISIRMTVCDIVQTRHRNSLNALAHILSGLTAYTFLDHQSRSFNPARTLA